MSAVVFAPYFGIFPSDSGKIHFIGMTVGFNRIDKSRRIGNYLKINAGGILVTLVI